MDAIDLPIALEALAHDIDMLVFRLETTAPTDTNELLRDRERLLIELERFRDRVHDLARDDRRL
jgi:hypothetical protein